MRKHNVSPIISYGLKCKSLVSSASLIMTSYREGNSEHDQRLLNGCTFGLACMLGPKSLRTGLSKMTLLETDAASAQQLLS